MRRKDVEGSSTIQNLNTQARLPKAESSIIEPLKCRVENGNFVSGPSTIIKVVHQCCKFDATEIDATKIHKKLLDMKNQCSHVNLEAKHFDENPNDCNGGEKSDIFMDTKSGMNSSKFCNGTHNIENSNGVNGVTEGHPNWVKSPIHASCKKSEGNCFCNGNTAFKNHSNKFTFGSKLATNSSIPVGDILVLNRKHVKLKHSAEDNSNLYSYENISNGDNLISDKDIPHVECYVMESVRRLVFTQNKISKLNKLKTTYNDKALLSKVSETALEIQFEHDFLLNSCCTSKTMRSSPKERVHKSISSEDSCDELHHENLFQCEWYECNKQYATIEKFTKHVKKEHIQPSSKNDVFVCLWRNCRFINQPSCSYKWLCKHVMRHCDVKPFKCVIFGCDMAFVTQNGLARHVPTHFNEGNVRRTCVKTNTSEASQHWESPKFKKSLNFKETNDSHENSRDSILVAETHQESRFERFVGNSKTKKKSIDSISQRNYLQLKRKLQQTTCSSVMNHGYVGKLLRIDHKVIGRRTLPSGESEMLLAPSINHIFPHKTMWIDAESFRQHQTTHIDLSVSSLSTNSKNNIYDTEYASKRRKRKRK